MSALPKRLILNVDDSEAGRYAKTRLLRRAHYEVCEAGSGREALQALAQRPPDLILLDVKLPDTTGVEICRSLKADPVTAPIPVLMISATYIESEMKVTGLESGADAYLAEPVEPELLLSTVRSLLRVRAMYEELRQTRAELEAERNRLSQILEQLPTGVIVSDGRSGRPVRANAECARILGFRAPAEALERLPEWRKLLAPDGSPVPAERYPLLQAMLDGRTISGKEFLIELDDGRRRNLSVSAGPIRDALGEIVAGVCAFYDITERKRAEEERQRFAHALQLAHVFIRDLSGRITDWTEGASRLYGWTSEEAVGRISHELLKTEFPEPLEAINRSLLRDGAWHGELRHTARNGQVISVVSDWVVHCEGGKPARVVEANTDITRRKKAEAALRESEARFRRLVESNIIGIIEAKMDRITTANDLFLDLLGYTREDLQEGRLRWRDITPAEYIEQDNRAIEELRSAGAATPFEKEYIRKDGTRVPVLIGASMIRTRPELEWICFILDLSERKRLEQVLLESQKLEVLGRLGAGIAHDFNNLLVGILGGASYLAEILPPDHEGRPIVDVILQASERASHLTSQIAAYAGKGRFVVEPVNLSRIIRDMAEILDVSIPGRIELRRRLADALPTFEADPLQIQQVVLNLVLNAVEAIPEGRSPAIITIATGTRQLDEKDVANAPHCARPGDFVYLEVRDTGSGMDEETKSKMFDPFFSTKFTGRGLGLAAVAGIIRSHEGCIKVESERGKGTTLQVYFPIASAARSSEASAD